MSGDYKESVKEIMERLISEREILKAAEIQQREEFIPAQEKADALWNAVKHNAYDDIEKLDLDIKRASAFIEAWENYKQCALYRLSIAKLEGKLKEVEG